MLGSRAETYCFQRTGICHSDQPPSVRILLVIASMKPHVSVERGNVFELQGGIHILRKHIFGHFWTFLGHFRTFLGLFVWDSLDSFWTILDIFGHFWTHLCPPTPPKVIYVIYGCTFRLQIVHSTGLSGNC